jgi:hypothetical protein
MVESILQVGPSVSKEGPTSVEVERKSLLDLIRKSVHVLLDVCILYGFDDTGYSPVGSYEWYTLLCEESYGGDWVKLFKDKLASFFAFHIADYDGVRPDLPSVKADANRFCPGILLGGRVYRWMRAFKRDDPMGFRGFMCSVLYSKKGFPRPTKAHQTRGSVSTYKTLTTQVAENVREEPMVWSEVDDLPTKPVSIISWGDEARIANPYLPHTFSQAEFSTYVDRIVSEVFIGEYTDADRLRPFFPSTSANYNNTRSALGTVGTILEHPTLLEGLRSTSPLVTSHVTRVGSFPDVVVDDMPLRERFAELYMRTVEAAVSEDPTAVPVSLLEALKIRTITKGPPLLGFALKPLQKFLWRTMSQHPTFRFTGEVVSADRLQAVLGTLKQGQKWLSADYSDATNSLYSWASDIVGNSLANKLKLSPVERLLLLRGLTGHIMELKEPGQPSQRAPQVRGQLMGSVVSFPVLCLVNAALCLISYELERQQPCKLRDLPLVINGDDAVLRGTPLLKEAWEKMAKFVGMLPSVGKVYYSEKYLNINSTSYWFHPEGYEWYQASIRRDGSRVWRARCFELIPYINMGLLYGMTRSEGAASSNSVGDLYGSLGTRAHALVDSAPAHLRLSVYKAYLSRNKERLSKSRVPMFTPTHLGGLGLPILGKFRPNDLDLRVARKIYDHPEMFQVPRPANEATWLTYKIASKRLHDFPLGPMAVRSNLGVGGESMESLAATLCIEALFMHNKHELNPELDWLGAGGGLTHSPDAALATRRGLKEAYELVTAELAQAGDVALSLTHTTAHFKLAMEKVREAHLNALRKLNRDVIRDTKFPLPEPFRLTALPARALDTKSLSGTHVLTLNLPFGGKSSFY